MKTLMRTMFVAALLLIPSLASALTYSGTLYEDGNPVTGYRFITLKVYDVPTGGVAIHTQGEVLSVSGGVFHTKLTAPDSVWYTTGRWIGVSVDGGAELVPRKEIDHVLRPSQTLVVRPSTSKIVSSSWTIVDSLTIVASTAGVLNINATGFGLWGGPGAQSGAALAISETTPVEPLTVLRAISGSDAFSMTLMVPVTSGTRTYYVWGYTAVPGGTYSINCQRFQALFIPN